MATREISPEPDGFLCFADYRWSETGFGGLSGDGEARLSGVACLDSDLKLTNGWIGWCQSNDEARSSDSRWR